MAVSNAILQYARTNSWSMLLFSHFMQKQNSLRHIIFHDKKYEVAKTWKQNNTCNDTSVMTTTSNLFRRWQFAHKRRHCNAFSFFKALYFCTKGATYQTHKYCGNLAFLRTKCQFNKQEAKIYGSFLVELPSLTSFSFALSPKIYTKPFSAISGE